MDNINLRTPLSTQDKIDILREENPDIKALLAVYPEEESAKLLANKDKLNKIIEMFSSQSSSISVSSMILTCQIECPYKNICVLKKEDMAPFGYPCPVEKTIASTLACDIIQSLNIEKNNPIEMELLWDLIDMKLLDMRASAHMKDGQLVQIIESQIGKSVSTRTELSPYIEAKIEIKQMKHSIIDSFVATRRSKKKYGSTSDSNNLEQLILRAAAKADTTTDA